MQRDRWLGLRGTFDVTLADSNPPTVLQSHPTMHCITLAEIAALLSERGPDLVASRTAIRSEAVTCYWASSRKRMALWNRCLADRHDLRRTGQNVALRHWWERNLPMLEEIIVSEMLTRVLAALSTQIELTTGRDDVSPVTHCVYLSHMDTSNRVHQLLIGREGFALHHAVRLNRLRQGVQRWTDTFIGRMALTTDDGLAFAFHHHDALAFAAESREYGLGQPRAMHCWLMNASMRDTLRHRTGDETAFSQANQDIANSVLSMLQPEIFDDLGLIKSRWLHQIERGADSAESMPRMKTDDRPQWTIESNDA